MEVPIYYFFTFSDMVLNMVLNVVLNLVVNSISFLSIMRQWHIHVLMPALAYSLWSFAIFYIVSLIWINLWFFRPKWHFLLLMLCSGHFYLYVLFLAHNYSYFDFPIFFQWFCFCCLNLAIAWFGIKNLTFKNDFAATPYLYTCIICICMYL